MKGKIEIKVRGYHVDGYSHVNNARYMEFLEEARWALAETDTSFMELRKTGYAFTAVNININYTSEACTGDTLIVTTELKTTGRKSITLSQKIYKKSDGKQVVDSESVFVLLDMNKGTAVELDETLKNLLAANG